MGIRTALTGKLIILCPPDNPLCFCYAIICVYIKTVSCLCLTYFMFCTHFKLASSFRIVLVCFWHTGIIAFNLRASSLLVFLQLWVTLPYLVVFSPCVIYHPSLSLFLFSAHHGPKPSRRRGSVPRVSRRRQRTHRLPEGQGKPGGQTSWKDVWGMSGLTSSTFLARILPCQGVQMSDMSFFFCTVYNDCFCLFMSRWWGSGKRLRDRPKTFHVLIRKLSSR